MDYIKQRKIIDETKDFQSFDYECHRSRFDEITSYLLSSPAKSIVIDDNYNEDKRILLNRELFYAATISFCFTNQKSSDEYSSSLLKEPFQKLSNEKLEDKANKLPDVLGFREVSTVRNQRNPYVVAYTLRRANGICELCEQPAPFNKSNGEPYLEVHHVKHLKDGGGDMTENAVALCPNCHRMMHSLNRKSDIDILILANKKKKI